MNYLVEVFWGVMGTVIHSCDNLFKWCGGGALLSVVSFSRYTLFLGMYSSLVQVQATRVQKLSREKKETIRGMVISYKKVNVVIIRERYRNKTLASSYRELHLLIACLAAAPWVKLQCPYPFQHTLMTMLSLGVAK